MKKPWSQGSTVFVLIRNTRGRDEGLLTSTTTSLSQVKEMLRKSLVKWRGGVLQGKTGISVSPGVSTQAMACSSLPGSSSLGQIESQCVSAVAQLAAAWPPAISCGMVLWCPWGVSAYHRKKLGPPVLARVPGPQKEPTTGYKELRDWKISGRAELGIQRTMQCGGAPDPLWDSHTHIMRVISQGLSYRLHGISQRCTKPTGKICDQGPSEVMKTGNFSCPSSPL